MLRFLLPLALLAGCSSIDYREGPVPGLERMTVEEHRVDASEIYQRCTRCGSLGMELPTACTCINFRTQHAVIWLSHDATQATIEHERAHGRGYDHQTGELRAQYAAWVNKGGKRAPRQVELANRAADVPTRLGELKTASAVR